VIQEDGTSSWDEGNGKEEFKEGGRPTPCNTTMSISSNGFIGGQTEPVSYQGSDYYKQPKSDVGKMSPKEERKQIMSNLNDNEQSENHSSSGRNSEDDDIIGGP